MIVICVDPLGSTELHHVSLGDGAWALMVGSNPKVMAIHSAICGIKMDVKVGRIMAI